ncbi:gliding motility-associated C-terminal domain-containing protein [Reichenbachiella agarivorans]|uniref:Gliding motility-associated C-terminal domain-containing protein n=1 Tax=Reichenbachiella agarivorans TaxID=2979464 RepID=A0ABY6CUD8_9BACT|nr:gliding motility-associated C-terminal domain-containing protein [Reichenbachiella agarivorans]UXP31860.1 gliding motility-associated C-terminal domain-containing protein [Reichenbachiella agarivorans]
MNSYRKLILTLPLLLISLILSAQEICDDGIDNDGDGFIDCYDGQCSGDAQCLDFYFGNSVKCQDAATQNPAFSVKLQWASADQTAFNSVTPAIGDIDADGTPEVVSTNRENNTLTILNGANGSTKHGPLNVGFDIAKTVAIANLDNDDCAEIFVRGFRNNNIKMYDCELNQIWSKTTNTGGKVGIISLADFNGDGVVELLHGNEIRNAHTGNVIIAGAGDFETEVTHGTVAIDILPDGACADCAGLEIVDGGKIYSVSIATQTRTLVRDINDILPSNGQYAIKYSDWNFNAAAVADYNLDGKIDVIFSGGQYVSGSLKTTAFFWDVTNNSVMTFTVPQNHSNATGRINVADIDGDGHPNCTFVSKQRLYALDENMQQMWYKDVNEGSSGFTGCTVFDFNADKASEIVYRGEQYVHIIDGKTGNSLKQIKCTSRTFEEYPVVADVDGDGATEICVACSTDDNTPFSPYSNGKYGQIRVFEADGGENWQPSRAIWNQHGYFNVNVNDDLTIPTTQQDPTKVFSTNVCTTGDNRPLNGFLNQAPYLNEDGCPSFVTPDIQIVSIVSVGQAQCPDVSFDVTIKIQNSGDVVLSGLLPITFYNGSPTEDTSIKLNTVATSISGFDVNETMDITAQVVGNGGDFDLYISVNDDGSQDPAITNFIRPIPECEDTNNLTFTPVTSQNFDLQHAVISHNEKCDPTKPNNGDAKVFYFGTISETVTKLWLEDFEGLATGTKTDGGSTAWDFTTRPSTADNLEVSFTGATNELFFKDTDGEAVWETQIIDISAQESVNISVDLKSSTKTDASNDYMRVYYSLDGGSEVGLTGGLNNGNFGSRTATATKLTGSTLKIIARVNNTEDDEFYYLDNLLVEGVTDPQTGEITAGFKFHWFKNNNFNDTLYTGSRIATLADGVYQVVASSLSNSCISAPEEITINKVQNLPNVVIEKTQDLTDCSSPNGILSAYVLEGSNQVTTGYTFKWYIGSDLTTVQSVGPVATNLQARTYSVVVKNNLSGCETILSEDVSTALVAPGISLVTYSDVTDCTNTASGSITVASDGPNADYTFNWYHGNKIKAVPDHTELGSNGGQTYAGLEPGDYSVEAILNSTGCISALLPVTIVDNSAAPTIAVTPSPNRSCTADGNGTATANVNGGLATNYTFRYYKGSNTLPANEILTTAGTGKQTAQLLSAGQYIVTATENATGCTGRQQFTIVDDIVNPTTPTNPMDDIDIIHVTSCNGTPLGLGSIDASALDGLDGVDVSEFEAIVNGSFEQPDIQAVFGSSTFKIFDQSLADGWSSDGDGNLEYWRSGFNGVPSVEGNQFAEINANIPGAFYFDIVTKPGIRMVWSFYHRGRAGDDTMALEIDDPSAATPIEIVRKTTGKNAWQKYTGEYIVPAGQTLTRFAFRAISTSGGNKSVGNFLDDVVFEVAPYYFELYSGSNSSGTPIASNATGIFDNLNNGSYTLKIVNNITGCPTDDIPVTIKVVDQKPILTRQLKTSDDYCVDGNGTQRITAKTASDLGEPVKGYDFRVYTGTDTTVAPYKGPFTVMNGDHTFQDLENGAYRVVVFNKDNGCRSFTDITITDNSKLPSFAAPIVSPNTTCDPGVTPNGFASANIFGLPKANFTWTWYNGHGAVAGTEIPGKINEDGNVNSTANNLINFPAGDYSVTAYNTVTGCSAGTQDITIPNDPGAPQINLSELAPNTGCFKGNGSITASVYVPSTGTNATDDYTFEWFLGADDTGTQLTLGADLGNNSNVTFVGVGGYQVDSLGAGTYTVRVTDPGNCVNTRTITINSNPSEPVIDATTVGAVNITPVSVCTGSPDFANGAIELTAVADAISSDTADFVYTWYIGASDTGTPIQDGDKITPTASKTITGATRAHIKGLEEGSYTVVATRVSTGCSSDPVTIDVDTTPITLNATLDPANTNNNSVCDILVNTDNAHDGKITIDPASLTGGVVAYTWEWYAGTDAITGQEIATIVPTADASAGNILDKIPGGDYTVKVTNITTGCEAVETFSIGTDVQNINLDKTVAGNVTSTPLSVCEGAATYPNGGVTLANATINGAAPTGALGYYWYYGNSVDAAKLLTDGVDIFNQKGIAGTANIAVAGANTAAITGLNNGNYTVVILDSLSGCTSNAINIAVGLTTNTYTASADLVTPGATVNNTVCDIVTNQSKKYDGQITINPNGGFAATDFTYAWFAGLNDNTGTEIATVVPSATVSGNVLSNIPGGDYTVRMTNKITNCSSLQSFNINTVEQDVVITNAVGGDVTKTPLSVCEGAATYPNGSINLNNITVGGAAADPTKVEFAWYFGSSVDPTKLISNGDNIVDLKAGSVTGVAAVPVAGATTKNITGLNNGNYTVVMTDLVSGCQSDPISIAVGYAPPAAYTATVDATPGATVNNTVCDITVASSHNGQITVQPDAGAVGDYTWTWFVGLNDNTPIAGYAAFTATENNNVLSNIPGGDYTVRMTHKTTNCSSLQSFNINTVEQDVVITNAVGGDVTKTPLSVCEGAATYPNGSINLNNITVGGAAADPTKVEFAWYFGSSVDPTKLISNGDNIIDLKAGSVTGVAAVPVAGATTKNISGLNNGNYTVVMTDLVSGCQSDPISIAVGYAPPAAYTATVDATPGATVNNTVCDITVTTTYNGKITILPTTGAVADYDYEWFVGLNDTTPIAGYAPFTATEADNVLSDIPKGDYTVRLTHKTTNCSNLQSFSINEDLTKPVINNTLAADVLENPNTVCEDATTYPNGSIDLANITGSGSYSYVWYYGTGIDASKIITNGTNILDQKGTGTGGSVVVIDAANDNISNLDAGFYTVVATDNATGCVSDPITIEIEDDLATLVIAASVTQDNFSCDVTTPTGEVTASVTSGTANYTLDWYAGTNTTGTSLGQTTNIDNTLGSLSNGTYTVLLTDIDTKCTQTAQVVIKRSIPIITLTMGQTDQTNCTPNGTATATPNAITYTNGAPINHAPIAYTYEWYEGQIVTGTTLAETGAVLSGQVAGYYTVVATETLSGCSSNAYTIKIEDGVTANLPTATISTGTNAGGTTGIIPTSCNGLGSIVADVATNPNGGNITFEWYEGSLDYAGDPSAGTALSSGTGQLASDPSANIIVSTTPGSGTSGYASLENIPSGLYTLVMIDGTTTCRSQETFDLPFLGQQATTTIAIKHVEGCPDDGEATVGLSDNIEITYINLSGTFVDGETVIASPSGATGVIYNDNGSSMSISTTSEDAFTASDDITGQTSLATADIDGLIDGYNEDAVDDISEYDIYLYSGSGVPADRETPYVFEGETFPKIKSGAGKAPGDTIKFVGLPAGTYTAVAREKSNPNFNPSSTERCFSASATDAIEKRSFAPIVDSYSIIDNTVCDTSYPAGANGSITVTARKDAEDTYQPGLFEFNFYEVGAESPGQEVHTESDVTTTTATALAPGDYIVYIDRLGKAGNTANGCQVTQTFTIQDDPEEHVLASIDAGVTHIVDCSGTGSITITDAMITETAADYTYAWYKDTYPSTALTETSATLSGQTAGMYFVEATHKTKGCVTSAVQTEILDNSEAPVVVISLGQADSYCKPGDQGSGILNWTITGATGRYTYNWYKGSTTGTLVAGTGITGITGVNQIITGGSLANIASGEYTIEVIDMLSPDETCSTTATFTVPEESPTVTIGVSDYIIVDNENCNGTGSFEITDVLEDGESAITDLGYDLAVDYSYVFRLKGNLPLTSGTIDPATPYLLEGLEKGDYQVTITNETSKCTSSVFFFSIDDEFELPNIVLTAKTDDTSCNPAANVGSGSLSAAVDEGGSNETAGYTFTWFRGTDTSATGVEIDGSGPESVSGTEGQTISDLAAGTYTVVVVDTTDPNNTCRSEATYTIVEDNAIITLTSTEYTITNNENCNGTGSIEITDVLEDGVATGNLANYTYAFAMKGGAALPASAIVSGADLNILEGLEEGEYQVTIQNKTTLCTSSTFTFSIDDEFELPNIVLTAKTDDASCDPAANVGSGSLSAAVDEGGSNETAGYTFTWFRGTDTSATGVEIDGSGPESVSGTEGQTISDLAAGTYTVVVVDTTDPNNTCRSEATYTIVEDNAIITLTSTEYTITNNENCNGTGSIEITDVLEDGVATGNLANYTYAFAMKGGAALPASAIVSGADLNILEGLEEGEYQVTIQNKTTLCTSSTFTFSIDDEFELPNIVLTAKTDDASCDPAANVGSGSLSAAVDEGGSNETAGYTFTWFRGTDTSATGVEIDGSGPESVSGTEGQTISDLAAGTYTVVVVDTTDPNNTCRSEATYTIVEDNAVITLTAAQYTVTNDLNCANDNGTITITDVMVDGVSNGGTAGFTFAFAKKDGTAAGAPHGGTQVGSGPVISDLSKGDYQVIITNTTTTCTSGTYFFNIKEIKTDPVAVLVSKTADTNCTRTGNNGDGSLTIALQSGAAVTDYSFDWYRGATVDATMHLVTGTAANIGSAVVGGTNGETVTLLAPGIYTVVTTDTNGNGVNDGCASTKSFEILNAPVMNTLDSVAVAGNITHIVDCGATNGTITINDGDLSAGAVTDYTFTWYTANPKVLIAAPSVTTTATSITLNDLAVGSYYVEAIHNTTGCSTGQQLFAVEDNTVAPEVTISVNTADTSCDMDANEGNGALDWTITNNDGGNYSYQWYAGSTVASGTTLVDGVGPDHSIAGTSGTGTFPTAAGVISGTLSGIDAGNYILVVTDNDNPGATCFVAAEIILEEQIPVYEVTAAINTDNLNCVNDNGSIEITGITENGGAASVANFTFTVQNLDGSIPVGSTPTATGATGLAAGDYQIIISSTVSFCAGEVYDFVIEDDITYPSVDFTLGQADMYCDGGNGELTVATDAAAPVTIEWTHDPAAGATITGLDSGPYEVTITDGVTGCKITETYTVPFIPEEIQLDLVTDVIMIPSTDCTPGNGSIELTSINPDLLSDYTYFLHTGNYTVNAGVDMGNNPVFTGLMANTYYIEAKSNVSGCLSEVFEIEVEDASTPPVVELESFLLQTNCDPSNPNGSLTVTADGSSSTTDYTFTWTGGPANDPTYAGLGDGSYTVTVENMSTGCVTTETFGMRSEAAEPLLLNITTLSNENCIGFNGELAIQVLNSTNLTAVFEYYLVEGENYDESAITAAANNLNGNTASGMLHGTYSIVVLDVDGGCSSDPNIIEILDATNMDDMEMQIVQDHALTKCDLTKADGQATVSSIPDQPSKFTFYWHDGPTLADPLLDSTFTVYQLIDQTYAIEMVDRYTGCRTDDSITITNETQPVPLPLVTLVNDRTNCVTPNGVLSAAINEETAGYSFAWSDINGDPVGTKSTASGLDIGVYTVKAKDLNTGCISDPVETPISDQRVEPFFKVATTDSQCKELVFGTDEYLGDGTADLIFNTNVIIEEIYWTFNSGSKIDTTNVSDIISQDERLSGIGPDDYRVMVVDDNQCTYEATFSIATDIKIFNAVTDNGDTKNDYFRITCADKFPNNNVKIFNRAGTLVYKADGYEDRVDGKVFTGKSNVGLGGGGLGLPAGTYFYIFDKGTGGDDDVQQGYLELLR